MNLQTRAVNKYALIVESQLEALKGLEIPSELIKELASGSQTALLDLSRNLQKQYVTSQDYIDHSYTLSIVLSKMTREEYKQWLQGHPDREFESAQILKSALTEKLMEAARTNLNM